VQTHVNNGDTTIEMSLADAKIILIAILEKDVADSIINNYVIMDSLKSHTIELQLEEIKILQHKSANQENLAENLRLLLDNKDSELKIYEDIIKRLKREVRKQKTLKIIGFVGSVVLPSIVLALTLTTR
jgi:signal recognition particle GTPase